MTGCTNFKIGDISAHSMEFWGDLKYDVMTNKLFVAVYADGIGVLDGVNTGLTCSVLTLNETTFGDVKNADDFPINEICRYILANFSTIDGIKKSDFMKRTVCDVDVGILPTMKIHFAIHDMTGSAVLRVEKGKLILTYNPTGVCANTLIDKMLAIKTDLTPRADPLDSGMVGLPGDWSSESRFMKTFVCLKFSAEPNHTLAAYHILNTLDRPKGTSIKMPVDKYETVQWRTIKDMKKRTLLFQTYSEMSPRLYF